jgi:hypothetical protein
MEYRLGYTIGSVSETIIYSIRPIHGRRNMKTVNVSEIIRTAQLGDTRYVLASEANERIKALEDAVKKAYCKHWLDDPDIAWSELGEILHDALCNSMGDKGFVEWLNEYRTARKALEVKP